MRWGEARVSRPLLWLLPGQLMEVEFFEPCGDRGVARGEIGEIGLPSDVVRGDRQAAQGVPFRALLESFFPVVE